MNTRIVEARKDKNMTQKEMASRLGVSATRVNYWEKGKAEPPEPPTIKGIVRRFFGRKRT